MPHIKPKFEGKMLSAMQRRTQASARLDSLVAGSTWISPFEGTQHARRLVFLPRSAPKFEATIEFDEQNRARSYSLRAIGESTEMTSRAIKTVPWFEVETAARDAWRHTLDVQALGHAFEADRLALLGDGADLEDLHWHEHFVGQQVRQAWMAEPRTAATKGRPRTKTDGDHLRVAITYVDAAEEGRPTGRAVANAEGCSIETARTLIRDARAAKMLVPTIRGRRRAELTSRAIRLRDESDHHHEDNG